MSGFLCGGVISESQHRKNVEEHGVWADTMSYVMDDENFGLYQRLRKGGKGDRKAADDLFRLKARSQI